MYTSVYPCIPVYTHVYTGVYPCIPVYTSVYPCIPVYNLCMPACVAQLSPQWCSATSQCVYTCIPCIHQSVQGHLVLYQHIRFAQNHFLRPHQQQIHAETLGNFGYHRCRILPIRITYAIICMGFLWGFLFLKL